MPVDAVGPFFYQKPCHPELIELNPAMWTAALDKFIFLLFAETNKCADMQIPSEKYGSADRLNTRLNK